MAQTLRTAQISSKSALVGSVPRAGAFTSRAAPRSLVVRAEQGPNDAAMMTIGAVAAAQIALLPLTGAAMADVFPSMGVVGANPAEQFANKAKAVGNKAKAAAVPDPLDTLAAKTKAAAQDVKGSLNKAGIPDPVKDLQKKAKSVVKNAPVNPAAQYANKGKKAVQSAIKKAPSPKNAVNKAKVANPAAEFAKKSQQAKNKAKGALGGSPLLTIGANDLQKNVLFGFGEKKVEKAASKVADKAGDVKDAGKDVAKRADEATPNSFSIFDASSVNDARQKLKANLDAAVNTKDDPAERVASIGKPGESQEENAERIRREAENGPTTGGDARAPTN